MRSLLLTTATIAALAILPGSASAANFHVGGTPPNLACNTARAQQSVANLGVTNVHLVVSQNLAWYFEGNVGRADNEYSVSKLTCAASLVGECLGLSGLTICPVHP